MDRFLETINFVAFLGTLCNMIPKDPFQVGGRIPWINMACKLGKSRGHLSVCVANRCLWPIKFNPPLDFQLLKGILIMNLYSQVTLLKEILPVPCQRILQFFIKTLKRGQTLILGHLDDLRF